MHLKVRKLRSKRKISATDFFTENKNLLYIKAQLDESNFHNLYNYYATDAKISSDSTLPYFIKSILSAKIFRAHRIPATASAKTSSPTPLADHRKTSGVYKKKRTTESRCECVSRSRWDCNEVILLARICIRRRSLGLLATTSPSEQTREEKASSVTLSERASERE